MRDWGIGGPTSPPRIAPRTPRAGGAVAGLDASLLSLNGAELTGNAALPGGSDQARALVGALLAAASGGASDGDASAPASDEELLLAGLEAGAAGCGEGGGGAVCALAGRCVAREGGRRGGWVDPGRADGWVGSGFRVKVQGFRVKGVKGLRVGGWTRAGRNRWVG